jgi:PPOX class probable F420-dependent enzyme
MIGAMSRMSPDVLAPFLRLPLVGVLATLRSDGRPYTVPVWWLYDCADVPQNHREPLAGDFWISGTTTRVWCRQLMRDPRASLCIESTDPVARHVEVDGECQALTRPQFDIWPMSRRLAEKYVGRGDPRNAGALARFFANMQTEPRLLFRLRPAVWRAIDLTVYRGKRADREFQSRPDAAR